VAKVPGVEHPAPVRGLPAQVSVRVNVREKFRESFSIARTSLSRWQDTSTGKAFGIDADVDVGRPMRTWSREQAGCTQAPPSRDRPDTTSSSRTCSLRKPGTCAAHQSGATHPVTSWFIGLVILKELCTP
jgi:hypothetical protein